jgi:hypothetical protein
MNRMMLMLSFVLGACSPGLDGPELSYPEWVPAHEPFEIEIVDPADGARFTYWWSLDSEPRGEFTGPGVNQTKNDPQEGTWRVVVTQEIDGVNSGPSGASIDILPPQVEEVPEEEEKPENADNDGDGVPVFSDCDDTDPENTDLKGSSPDCTVSDCASVQSVYSFHDAPLETGVHWMKCETDGVSAYQMLCDFAADDGPWGLVLTTPGTDQSLAGDSASWDTPVAESDLFTTGSLIRLSNTESVSTQVSYGALNLPVNALRLCIWPNQDPDIEPVCTSHSFDAASTLWSAVSGAGNLMSIEGEVFLDSAIEAAAMGERPGDMDGYMGYWAVHSTHRKLRIGFEGVEIDGEIGEFGIGFAQGAVDSDLDPAERCSAGMVTRPMVDQAEEEVGEQFCHPVSIWVK